MRRIMFCFLLLCGTRMALGQDFPSDVWHEGKVVLTNEETYKGFEKHTLSEAYTQRETQTL